MPALSPTATPGETSFRALFDAHAVFVWRVLRRYGVAESDLADGCQEVFLVRHRRLSEFEGRCFVASDLPPICDLQATDANVLYTLSCDSSGASLRRYDFPELRLQSTP